MSRRRVAAIVRKDLRDYMRNRYTLWSMAVIPLVFLAEPLISILKVSAAGALPLRLHHELLYMLAIPALVPALLAAASIVSERQQGTLEPVLSTPIRREELVLAKALAPLVPSLAISYAVYALFVVVIELFANPGVPSILLQADLIVVQVVFTPLLALWSIWVGTGISTRVSDIRAAQQLSILGNLPVVALSVLISLNVIHASLRLAIILGVALLVVDRLGWRVVSALFDRERLITGTAA